MIKSFEKYHGSVLCNLIHRYGEIKIVAEINQDNSSYLINNSIGVYIKFSTKRLTPWQFTFNENHHKSIINLYKSYKYGYVIFVCNDDGFCCINFNDYFTLINDLQEGQAKSVSISRFKNEQYYVSGSDGELKNKIPKGTMSILET